MDGGRIKLAEVAPVFVLINGQLTTSGRCNFTTGAKTTQKIYLPPRANLKSAKHMTSYFQLGLMKYYRDSYMYILPIAYLAKLDLLSMLHCPA